MLRKHAKRQVGPVQGGGKKPFSQLFHQPVLMDRSTETLSKLVNSVRITIRGRDDGGDDLALRAGQLGMPDHHDTLQRQR